MDWIIPGKPYKTAVLGRVITVKSMSLEERDAWAQECQGITEDNSGFVTMVKMMADRIISIEGVDGPVYDFLSHQGADLLLLLQRLILTGNAITGEQAKNSASSLAASTPVKQDTPTNVTNEAVSNTPTA